MNPSKKALLVDLDGTFLDTSQDFLNAFITIATPHNFPIPTLETLKFGITGGVRGMLKVSLPIEHHADIEKWVPLFLSAYQKNLSDHTCLYEGFEEIMRFLKTHQMAFGVVTNKPAYLTDKLLAGLGLTHQLDCIVSGDTAARAKPFPDPLLYALDCLGMKAEEALYVGDAERDIEAAIACNMPALAAAYGYLEPDADPHAWGAQAVIHSPLEILPWL